MVHLSAHLLGFHLESLKLKGVSLSATHFVLNISRMEMKLASQFVYILKRQSITFNHGEIHASTTFANYSTFLSKFTFFRDYVACTYANCSVDEIVQEDVWCKNSKELMRWIMSQR